MKLARKQLFWFFISLALITWYFILWDIADHRPNFAIWAKAHWLLLALPGILFGLGGMIRLAIAVKRDE